MAQETRLKTDGSSSVSATLLTQRNVISCIFLVVFWTLPTIYIGLTNKDVPWIPRTLGYLQRISFLFTHSIENWPVYYVQALPENSKDWFTLTESEFFKLKPFGYRTRLHQYLYYSKDLTDYEAGKKKEAARHKELVFWMKERYAQLHPQAKDLQAMRIVVAFYYPQEKSFGRWEKPALDSFAEDNSYILSTYYFSGQ